MLGMKRDKSDEGSLRKIIHLMQTDKSVDAPQDCIKWAKDIFRTRAAEPKKSLVQKVLAVLQVDLSSGKVAFGERSASTAQARQMLFSAGENAVDLRVKETEGAFELRGQILGAGFENCTVMLGGFETIANDLSEFKLTGIPPAKYELILRKGDREIIISNLELS